MNQIPSHGKYLQGILTDTGDVPGEQRQLICERSIVLRVRIKIYLKKINNIISCHLGNLRSWLAIQERVHECDVLFVQCVPLHLFS